MVVKFKDDIENNVDKLKNEYFEAVRNDADPETIENKYAEYMAAFSSNLHDNILKDAREEALNANTDEQVLMKRGQNVLTSEEKRFFTNLVEDDANLDTYKEEIILPETTVSRVFEDMQSERPLLSKINFQIAGIKTRIIAGDPDGAAMWGEIFGKIQGQIQANFREYTFSQNKLTAFAIVPKDLLDFGPEWVERYVRLQLAEAMGAKLEEGIVKGNGPVQNQPVGLIKDMVKDDSGNITSVKDKTEKGKLTFADAKTTVTELSNLMNSLSVKEDGKRINISGKVSLLVNPDQLFAIQAKYTIQNANGQWVTSLPFNLDILPSEFVEKGKIIAFVPSRYYAMYKGATQIREYGEVLALEDANVYIAKQYAHGMPDDNKVAEVYSFSDVVVAESEESDLSA
ncbi:TPA: phage major capsid protein [Staphylococcus pseudintermedius]|uniref:phage major capsid protein n=1 Tax=Staphylococcus pseudintermedius TaxID=283734 RepID=UPI0019F9A254|nr:phage major capsid protein [Staphylococcus pseudintermedius]EGQ2796915.1 phage major capsid protein [Staphylococcus pseudintermedius]EHA6089342.1 phage major capsid protein [Staphylococcus pseudintermedius]EHD5216176.1 phage major capsid protein [Staphylococcus pseudintermedius]EHS7163196.1 phage major capsid protein [Staphylococcus pseudintermedius]EIE3766623.1 phage major capsid protein [Staphylococcus pseudintermedius]